MRLIDADALSKKWQEVLDEKADEKGTLAYITFELFIDRLKEEPTIEAEPVRHGRWIGAPLCGNDNCRCSACGSWHNIHANLHGEIMQKYCPNCGAKMDIKDGGDNDAAD